jgi:DNA-binding GntR family transcriptional regulator
MQKENLKQQAYHTIKEKIITCQYYPNTDLTEAFLLADTALGRTPIRDALSRLEQENLVTIIPKKGVRVSDVTINDINIIYEMRNLIEPYVIRRYGERLDKQDLLIFKRKFEQLLDGESVSTKHTTKDLRIRYNVDDSFHQSIIQSSRNAYLILSMKHIVNQNSRLRALTSTTHKRLTQSHPEHVRIIDFLLRDDYENAALAMEEHLAHFKQASFEAIINNGGWLTP